MPAKQPKKVYVANESFVAQDERGIEVAVHQNRTRVREGDYLLEKYPHLFFEDDGQYEDYS